MARILIVEDEKVVAWHIRVALEKLGHVVVASVTTGKKAIQTAAELRPDLILMDIRLRGSMTGIVAAEQIYSRFDIPVIYLTAYTDAATLQQAIPSSPFGYLAKPIRSADLQATIQVTLHRHQQEQTLRQTQQWLTTLLTSMGDATIATNLDGTVTFINPVAEQLTGWPQPEAVGQPITCVLELIDADTHEAIENPVLQAVQQDAIIRIEEGTLLRAKDGTKRAIFDSAAPIKNDEGDIMGGILVFQDSAERAESSTQLRQPSEAVAQAVPKTQLLQASIQKLGQLLEATYCWIALYTPGQAFDQLSEGVATVTCAYVSERLEQPPLTIGNQIKLLSYPQFYLPLCQRSCWVAPPLDILPTSYQSLLASGNHLSISPLFDDQRVIGEIGILSSDDLLWSEAEIELISQVMSQVWPLDQMTQASEELEPFNRLKENFLNSVSYELRTPLTNMRIVVKMLQRIVGSLKSTESNPDVEANKALLWQRMEQYLQILQDEWQQEFDLINNFLDLQTPETSTELLPLVSIDLAQWLPSIVDRFAATAARQRQTLIYQVSASLPTIRSHLPSLERVITELLTNACKYTPLDQQIRVTAGLEANQLKLAVTNTGIEIPADQLERIFQPLYRVAQPNAWNYRGTGLGLALVKRLMVRLEGEIQVESEAGQTTFVVTLPLR